MQKQLTLSRKIAQVLLSVVLVVGFLPVCQPQKAYANMPAIALDTPYTFTFTGYGGWQDVSFTAPESAKYVFTSSDRQGIGPRGDIYSDSSLENRLVSADSYEAYDNNFIAELYIEKDVTVYLEVWNDNNNAGSVVVTVTKDGQQQEPEALYEDYPCFAEVGGGGTVFAFEPGASGDYTFRIYAASDQTNSLVEVTGVLYSDSGLANEVATSSSDDSKSSVFLSAELQLGRTYYLKVVADEYAPNNYCAVVVSPSGESSFNDGDWSLKTDDDHPLYLDGDLNLHGNVFLNSPDGYVVDSESYDLIWFAVDGTSMFTPQAEGYFAMVALAADDSDYSSARLSYVNVWEANHLTSCEFVETNPMIVDGKLVMDKSVIWLGDNSVVDPSVYDLVWYGEESEPTTAGSYILLANYVENSGWTGQLAQAYDVPAYTSTALALDEDDQVVNFGEDVVLSFTPTVSGSYSIALQGNGDAGYFKVLAIGDRVDFGSDSAESATYGLEAGTTYYLYVDSFNQYGSITVSVSLKEYPGGALTQDVPFFVDVDGEDALFTFTAPSAGAYFFRTFGDNLLDATLYADAALTQQLATSNGEPDEYGWVVNQEDYDGVYLQADLTAGQTVFLKIGNYDEDANLQFATIVSAVADNSITVLGWDQSFDQWYVGLDGSLHGAFYLLNKETHARFTEGKEFSVSWYDVNEGKLLEGAPTEQGRYAGILTGRGSYTGARVLYTDIYAENDLGFYEFVDMYPCIIDGQFVWNDAIDWTVDFCIIDRSLYTVQWIDENCELLVDDSGNPASPTQGGNYTVIADPTASGWCGQLQEDVCVNEYTVARSVQVGSTDVYVPNDVDTIVSFTPEESGTYELSVDSGSSLGSFQVFGFGEAGKCDFGFGSVVKELQADCAYYIKITHPYYDEGQEYVTVSVALQTSETVDLDDADVSLSQEECSYSGAECKPTVSVSSDETTFTEGVDYTVEYSDNVNAGQAAVTVTAVQDGPLTGQVVKYFTIVPASVEVPAAATDLVYDDTSQTGVAAVPAAKYTVTGGSATDAGSYTATVRLKDAKNYRWSDGTSTAKQITWSIAQAQPKVTVSTRIAAVNYNGSITKASYPIKEIKVNDVVVRTIASDGTRTDGPGAGVYGDVSFAKVSGTGSLAVTKTGATAGAITGKVTVQPATPVGEYTAVVRVTVAASADGNYAAATKDVPVKVQVKRFTPTISILGKVARTVSYATLKTKSVTVDCPITKVQCASKPITYELSSAKNAAGKDVKASFKVNKTTGKVTVAKGLAKGTYKLNIKVMSDDNANYKGNYKVVACTVKVA